VWCERERDRRVSTQDLSKTNPWSLQRTVSQPYTYVYSIILIIYYVYTLLYTYTIIIILAGNKVWVGTYKRSHVTVYIKYPYIIQYIVIQCCACALYRLLCIYILKKCNFCPMTVTYIRPIYHIYTTIVWVETLSSRYIIIIILIFPNSLPI